MAAVRIAKSNSLGRILGQQSISPLCSAFSAVPEILEQEQSTSDVPGNSAAPRYGSYGAPSAVQLRITLDNTVLLFPFRRI